MMSSCMKLGATAVSVSAVSAVVRADMMPTSVVDVDYSISAPEVIEILELLFPVHYMRR